MNFESTFSVRISLYPVSCIGIAVIALMPYRGHFLWNFQDFHIFLIHYNNQKYPKLQGNGGAEATSEFLSARKLAFCNPHFICNLYWSCYWWCESKDSNKAKEKTRTTSNPVKILFSRSIYFCEFCEVYSSAKLNPCTMDGHST